MQRILTLNSLFYLGVILTYPGFFIFNPFASGFTVLGIFQSISTAGWIISVCLPLIHWIVRSLQASRAFLVASILVWPVSLLLIRALMGIIFGNPGFQYLITSPIFLVTDFIAPALLIWWVVREGRIAARTSA